MKLKFLRSITLKLLLLNIPILCIFGIIIAVVHSSFTKIEASLKTTIKNDVGQVIENGQLGREFTRVFADLNLLTSTFYGNNDLLKAHKERLMKMTVDLIVQITDTQLRGTFRRFDLKLQALLIQGFTVNDHLQEIRAIEQEFTGNLDALEKIVTAQSTLFAIDGQDGSGDVAGIEQLKNVALPKYRETLPQIALQLVSLRQEYAEGLVKTRVQSETVTHPIFALLGGLKADLQVLTSFDSEIAAYGAKLIEHTLNYKKAVTAFQLALLEFQTKLGELNNEKEQVLAAMKTKDEQVAQTTARIQEEIAARMDSARQNILILSALSLGILGVTWLSTRWVARPLVQLSQCAEQLADGDITCEVLNVTSADEIGTLSRAFQRLIAYFREMAQVVTEISRGNLDLAVPARSPRDVLGNGFQRMVVYLKEMGKFATHVAAGDLRSQISLRSQTDQLGNAFIHMQQGLIALIAEIRAGADSIALISKHILGTSTKNADALEHIGNAAEVTSSAMRQVSSSAEEVRLNTEHLSSSVEETSASITQMISSIKHVAENTRKLSGFADDTRATMTNIVNSLEKVAAQAEHSRLLSKTTTLDAGSGQESVEQMILGMTSISAVTRNIAVIVTRLEDRSKEIGTILDVINEVAEQTSLLALNASIIAAQAGVHGRGFAVVADEIKELATRVGTSTKEIAKIVKSVQHDSSDAVKALEQGRQEVESGVTVAHKAGEALQKIGRSAENSSGVAAEIAVLVRQQSTASSGVAESIQDVTNMVNEITQATQEQEKNSSQLFTVVENMQALAAQVSRATQEQQQSTIHVTDFMEDVISLVNENMPTVSQLAQSADELAARADMLTQQVERFSTDA